jgi:uncharacterized integral membrane protein
MATDAAGNPAPMKHGACNKSEFFTRRRIIAGVVAIIALLFILQNTATGHFNFLLFDFKAPQWLWLLGVFAAGFASGWLLKRHRADAKR